MNTLSIQQQQQQQHQQQSHGMVLLTRQRQQHGRPASALLLRTSLVTLLSLLPLLLLLLLSLLSTTNFVNAATTESSPPPPPPSSSSSIKPHPTKSTLLTPTPTPTPTPIIPEQCQDCYNGPNNTLTPGMTCFKGTQCVPLQYLCDSVSSPTCYNSSNSTDDDDNNNDGVNDNGGGSRNVPILCENQLCNPQNFPPLPYQGSGRIDRTYCLNGSFYSLYSPSDSSGSNTPKYTASCVEESMFLATDGSGGSDDDCIGPWEYFAIGTCFLKTCGPGMDCVMPFSCQLFNSTTAVPGVGGSAEQGYGICVDPNGSSSGGGKRVGINGGSAAPKYSSSEYLLQGLLIGLCTLALGVGLGVGFWRYKRKKQFQSDYSESHQQHRTRRRRTSSHGEHSPSRSHSRSSRNSRSRGDEQAEFDAEVIPPPPPLLPLNNNNGTSYSSSYSNASTKKKPSSWHSFLCGPCFDYRRRRQRQSSRTESRRRGGSRTVHSASSLNRFSTSELDHHSQHAHIERTTTRRRRDSRVGEGTETETETDSQDDSSIDDYHRHHSQGRTAQTRWRWGQSTQSSSNGDSPMMMIMLPRPPPSAATTGGAVSASARGAMTVVLPEFEPPPMYHRQDDEHGPNLPTYGDVSNSSGSSSGIDALGQAHATDRDRDRDRDREHSQEEVQQQQQQQQRIGPLLPSTAAAGSVADPEPALDQETSSVSSTHPTTPLPSSQPSPPPLQSPNQQLQ